MQIASLEVMEIRKTLRMLFGLVACLTYITTRISVYEQVIASPRTHIQQDAGGLAHPPQYLIQINTEVPVLKLYEDGKLLRMYPVALGAPKTQTPIGHWRVVDKQRGWGNGFGTRWLGLDVPWGIYGIHGTNRPSSIGQYASNGCIRMYNKDVEELYKRVPEGTPVVINGNPLMHLRALEFGNIGADVQLVQRRLQVLGFYRGSCDGRFDIKTQYALILFQLWHDIPMDGAVSRDDYQALKLIALNTH